MTPRITALFDQVATAKAQYERAKIEFLATLPGELGYESADELIAAIRQISQGGGKASLAPSPVSAARGPRKGRRTRATITQSMRAQVVSLLKEGKTAKAVAAAVGISIPSVQNIKKAAGMVGANGPQAKAPKAAKAKPAKKSGKKAKKATKAKVVAAPAAAPAKA